MFKSKTDREFLKKARQSEKAIKPFKLLPGILGAIPKIYIKAKIEKLFSVRVTEITREWLTVESTDKNTEHLNKSMLHTAIRLETDLMVVVL